MAFNRTQKESGIELDYDSPVDMSYLNNLAFQIFGRPTALYRTLLEYSKNNRSHDKIMHSDAKSLCDITMDGLTKSFHEINQENNLPTSYDYNSFALLYIYLQRKGYIEQSKPLPCKMFI